MPCGARRTRVEPAKFEGAALRWLARFITEAKPSLLKAQTALAALVELRVSSEAARKLLLEMASRSPTLLASASKE